MRSIKFFWNYPEDEIRRYKIQSNADQQAMHLGFVTGPNQPPAEIALQLINPRMCQARDGKGAQQQGCGEA